jgi:DNA polymerase-3 subunit beta
MLGGTLETALKLTVSQSNLQKGLGIVSRAVSPRSTLPVPANVLLKAEAGRLMLAATNLELGIVTWIDATVQDEGAVTVPARLLGDLVGTLPNEPVSLTVNPNTCTLTVKCGKSSTEIKGIDAGEFPPMPARLETSTAVYRSDTLKAMFERVTFAASTDEARPVLQGVHTARTRERVTMCATDGFRVSVVTGEDCGPSEGTQTALLPAGALKTVAALTDPKRPEDVLFEIDGARAIYQGDTWMVVTQTIDGNFPNWRVIEPKRFKTTATLPRALTLAALKQADVIARNANGVVKLGFRPDDGLMGVMDVTASSEERGEFGTTLALAELEGPTLEIAFNLRYLREAIEAVTGETVRLEMSDNKGPARITDAGEEPDAAGYKNILMPMHI